MIDVDRIGVREYREAETRFRAARHARGNPAIVRDGYFPFQPGFLIIERRLRRDDLPVMHNLQPLEGDSRESPRNHLDRPG